MKLGVHLTPIIVKEVTDLEAFRGRSMAMDAFNVLHQFLALIRTREGKPLSDNEGRITSHLVGLVFRATRLMADYQMELVFVFDGKLSRLKRAEVERRRIIKQKAEDEYAKALETGDYAKAFSKAVQTGRLDSAAINDAKKLLELLGIPWVQAPSEGEAQASYMARRGDVWAASSRDYDSLLFGAPRLVRYLTIQGQEWLPSKRKARRLEPEIIHLEGFLNHHGITRKQLVDLSILVGTDFNPGVKGVGSKTALKLVKAHGQLEDMPGEVAKKIPENFDEIRRLFLDPDVTDDYDIKSGFLKEEELVAFLCDERDFSKQRIDVVISRIKRSQAQKSLTDWFHGGA